MTDRRVRRLEEAQRRHRAGDAEGALAEYRRFLDETPDHAGVRMLAAMAAGQCGRPREAVKHARRAVAARDDAASRLTLARALLQVGEPEDALESLRLAAREPATAADAAFHMGQALRHLGREREAAEALEAAVKAFPGHGPAWNELGVVRMSLGLAGPARDAFVQSLRVRRGDADVSCNLALAHLCLGDLEAADAALEGARGSNPVSSRSMAVRGRLERHRGRLVQSLAAWEQCVEIDAASADGWAGLGSARQAAGDMSGAEQAYRRALELAPGNADALAGLAEWHEWQGRYEEGLALLEGCVGDDLNPVAEIAAGRLLRRLGRLEAARSRLENAVPAAGGDAITRRQLAFSLGDVCDALGDFSAAWEWYAQGNALTPARFDPAAHRRRLKRLAAAGDGRRTGEVGEGIVFIVGLPRSGTTLLEQVLAAHGDVVAAGELPHLGRLMAERADDDAPGRHGDAAGIGDRYLEAVAGDLRPGALLTDKMPLNYQYVDVIGAALPGARIVHCRRDPRDVALSCYFTDFIDPALGFATRLDWLAEYLLAYRDFMARPRPGLAGRIVDLHYERLVSEPEATLRELLDFLGLPWNPDCLEFSKLDRVAATASHAQVRRPLYTTSVGRWRSYVDRLSPLLDKLAG